MLAMRKWVSLLVISVSPTCLAAEELPPGAYAQFGTYRFYHGPGISGVALSADGSRIATFARHRHFSLVPDSEQKAYAATAVVWDAATGERLREFKVPESSVYCLALSADGSRLAVAYESGVQVFDVGRGTLLWHFKDVPSPHHLQFSAGDKQLLVTEFMRAVRCLDLTTGKQVKRWVAPAGAEWLKEREYVYTIHVTPDGAFIAWLVDKAPDYSKVPSGVHVLPYAPCPTALLLTEAATDKVLYRKTFELHALDAFVFAVDGKRFFAGSNKVTAYDAATGKEQVTLDVSTTSRLTPSPDGKCAVITSGWSEVRMWDLQTKKPLFDLSPGLVCMYYSSWVFSGDGKTLLLATDSTLRLFDPITGKERTVPGHRYPAKPRFSADGRTLWSSCAEATCTWDLAKAPDQAFVTRQPRKSWEVLPWDYSADGRLLLERSEGKVRVVDTATGRVVSTLENARYPNFGLLSGDGTRVMLWWWSPVEGVGEGVWLHDAKTGKKTGEFKPAGRVSLRPVLSGDGRLLAWADEANGVTLYDAVTGKVVTTLRSINPLPRADCNDASLVFSPDGKCLIVTTYSHNSFSRPEEVAKWHTFPTRVFDVASGKEISRFYWNLEKRSQSPRLSCAACSADNRMLAVAEEDSGAIVVIEIATGKVRLRFAGHRHGVHGLAFSPDGTTLASGGIDNVVFLWDLVGTRTGKVDKKGI